MNLTIPKTCYLLLFGMNDTITVSSRVPETDFATLGSNVSYKLGCFSNSELKFLDGFLKHAKKL